MTKIAMKVKRALAGPTGQRLIQRSWLLPAAAIIWVVLVYGIQTIGLTGRVDRAIGRFVVMEKELASAQPPQNQALAAMRQKSLFAPPSPPPQPPQCTGILGDRALFGDRWLKAGEEVQGAKILAVDATGVKISWEGKEQFIRPFEVAVQYTQGSPGRRPDMPPPQSVPQPQAASPETPRNGGPGLGRGGFPDFRNMSPEELAKMRDKFMNMSPEERRAAAEEMRRNRSQ